ncbi:MAG: hypothetical protein ABI167_06195 [Nitrosospira sp.]
MKTTTPLASLESNVGIFGWIWIVASLAALYFLAMAIFADGAWSSFIWTVGIGILAQRLTKSFQDNQRRMIFEARLIREGYTLEHTGNEWVSKSNEVDK